ncbi:uncharacterized protein [Henckelia pumila]|uniref:uncharacterized protein n=1 Tax=Henckelia pumila TaxID=405737 RepID=UPI003C6E6375
MDLEEITRLVEKMKLSSGGAEDVVQLDENDISIEIDSLSNCLVAKFFFPKAINRVTFIQHMFVFEFSSQKDRARALADGPWNFSRNLLVVSSEVTKAALRVLNDGESPKPWSKTLVTLIPKVKDAMLMKEFSRLITDNIMVGFEVLHWIRNRKAGKTGYAALKLDVSKAYDRIEWEFLFALLRHLGFKENWVKKIMKCVMSVSYSFRVNQEGCPLVSHLFFLDDRLVFFRASIDDGTRILKRNVRTSGGEWRMVDENYTGSVGIFSVSLRFEEAKLGHNPSYIWRSLMWSRELLKKGLMWRVGDGKSIKIFEDKWIPSLHLKMGNGVVQWTRDPKVSSLIIDGAWDEELITTSINAHVAGEISKIPLHSMGSVDSRFWSFDSKVWYSLRDRCRLQRGLFEHSVNQFAYLLKRWWSFLWSLSLPPKVRLFWWSATHDCIPTNLNLGRHHVPVGSSCSLCSFPYDSTCHSLFHCAAIKHLWKNTPFANLLKVAKEENVIDLCLRLQDQLNKLVFENFVMHG